jgi:hypothetical protein
VGLDPAMGELTRLFHPRTDVWTDRFRIAAPAIEGLTEIGRTTIALLPINHADSLDLRGELIAEGIFGRIV